MCIASGRCKQLGFRLVQCKGFGSKCIVDLNGAPNPLFLVGSNALLSGELDTRFPQRGAALGH